MLLLSLIAAASASCASFSRQQACALADLVVIAEAVGHGETVETGRGPKTRVDLRVLRTIHGPRDLTVFSIPAAGAMAEGQVVSSVGGAPRLDIGSRHLLYFATAEGHQPMMLCGTWKAVTADLEAVLPSEALAARHQQGCRETYADGVPPLRLVAPE